MKYYIQSLLFVLLFTGSIVASNENLLKGATQIRPMPMDGWRFGVGLGYALYVGDQMDKSITSNYGEFKELRTNVTLAGFKQINTEMEWGLVMKFGSFQSLLEQNTRGIQCDFKEIQSIWQKSLNDNLDLNGSRFTFNLQYGIGFLQYKSMFFAVNPNFQTIDYVISSVGYGYGGRKDLMGNELSDIPKKKMAVVGNLGLNIGFRISRNASIYFENSFQITTSSKLTGNLNKVAKIPPDAYYYTGLSLFYRFGMAGGRLGCPRF